MKTFKFGESKIYLHNNDLPNNIQPPKIISVDTETTGLSLIRDRLCMVQIAFSKTECHLIKFDKDFFDRTTKRHKVRDILKDEKIEKIFHFARFDVAMLNKFLKLDLKNIFWLGFNFSYSIIAFVYCRLYIALINDGKGSNEFFVI